MPLTISIITICYNNAKGLEKTIKSVVSQTYTGIEYIIIDGGSSDNSPDLLKAYESSISYCISEPDNGIYDAMNKGIDRSNGEYVLFLNAGDCFYNNKVIEDFCALKPSEDVVYGNTLIHTNGKMEFKCKNTVVDLASSLSNTINHQSIFHHKRLFEKNNRYSLDYPIIADWVFINDAARKRTISFRYIDLTIALYDGTGISSDFVKIAEEREHYLQSTFSPAFLSLLKSYQHQVSLFHSFRRKAPIKQLLWLKKTFLKR